MKCEDLALLFQYSYWATERILSTTEEAGAEPFLNPLQHSHGSLRGTLVHMFDAEYSWRLLCQYGSAAPELAEADFPVVAALRGRWKEEENEMRLYLAGLQDLDLLKPVESLKEGGQRSGPLLWHCLFHVLNHGMQHRSEVALILTDYGYSPGDLDFAVFMIDR